MKVYMYVVTDKIGVRFNGEAHNKDEIKNSLEFFEYSQFYDFEIGKFYMVEKMWSYEGHKSNRRVSSLVVTVGLNNIIKEFVEDNLQYLDVTKLCPMWKSHTQIELETIINNTYDAIQRFKKSLDTALAVAERDGFNHRFVDNRYSLYSVNPNYLYKASPKKFEPEEY